MRKLRIENAELVKKVAHACGNARHMEVTIHIAGPLITIPGRTKLLLGLLIE